MNYLKLVVCRTSSRCHYVALKHLNYPRWPFELLGHRGVPRHTVWEPQPLCVSVHMLHHVFIFAFIPKCAVKVSCQMYSRHLGVGVGVHGGGEDPAEVGEAI